MSETLTSVVGKVRPPRPKLPHGGEALSRGRMLALLFFMTLWPWACVSFGLFVIRSAQWTMVIYELLCCALPVVLLSRWPEGLSRRLSVLVPLPPFRCLPLGVDKRWLLLAILAANVMFLGIFKQTDGVMMDWPVFHAHMRAIGLAVNPLFWLFAVLFVTVNPALEELFWRGCVYRHWRGVLGPWRANLLSSFFFGLWHWLIIQYVWEGPWAIVCTLAVMTGGVIFAHFYEKTRSLGAPILLHSLGADLPLVFMAYTALMQGSLLH